jgi:hypothetical protein
MRVDKRILDVSMTEQSHDMKDILRLVVLHCGPEMAESLETDCPDTRVPKLLSDPCSTSLESPAEVIQ